MGKGIPFLEQRERNHFLRVEREEWQDALAILGMGLPARTEDVQAMDEIL